jgi:hypothetical protein
MWGGYALDLFEFCWTDREHCSVCSVFDSSLCNRVCAFPTSLPFPSLPSRTRAYRQRDARTLVGVGYGVFCFLTGTGDSPGIHGTPYDDGIV